MQDPVLRNLWITQRYHELAVQLRDMGMAEDATWCAFAVWASKTAGKTIRGEELPERVKVLLDGPETEGALHRFNSGLEGKLLTRLDHLHLFGAVKSVSDQVSESIAAGNLMVFTELAPLFIVMVEGMSNGIRADREAMAVRLHAALDHLTSQGIDAAGVSAAFDGYLKALDDPAARPTLVLAANIHAVSHEQERLQPAIVTALDAPLSNALTNIVTREITRRVPTKWAHRAFDKLVNEVGRVLDQAWQTALTEILLCLETFDEKLELHRDLPPLADGLYPPMLADLKGSAAEGPFARWDRTLGKGAPTGAHDWAEIDDRMNYIVNLFRSRQRHPALFNPPFSPAQLASLAADQLPAGHL